MFFSSSSSLYYTQKKYCWMKAKKNEKHFMFYGYGYKSFKLCLTDGVSAGLLYKYLPVYKSDVWILMFERRRKKNCKSYAVMPIWTHVCMSCILYCTCSASIFYTRNIFYVCREWTFRNKYRSMSLSFTTKTLLCCVRVMSTLMSIHAWRIPFIIKSRM